MRLDAKTFAPAARSPSRSSGHRFESRQGLLIAVLEHEKRVSRRSNSGNPPAAPIFLLTDREFVLESKQGLNDGRLRVTQSSPHSRFAPFVRPRVTGHAGEQIDHLTTSVTLPRLSSSARRVFLSRHLPPLEATFPAPRSVSLDGVAAF